MTERNQYLKIDILMEDGVHTYHYERLTTNENITFNNFIAKFGRDANGFITVKEKEDFASISVQKVLKMTPAGIHELNA